MKLENINLLEVETNEGFREILDLEEVTTVSVLCNYAIVRLRNGLIKCVIKKYAYPIMQFLKES